MCFIIDEDFCHEPQIAKEDIVCYKRFITKESIHDMDHYTKDALISNGVEIADFLPDRFYSPYRIYEYEADKVYSIPEIKTRHMLLNGLDVIDEGFHAYRNVAGIRSYTYALLRKRTSEVIAECIIPKGATYWFNEIEIVSTAIKIIKIVE